MATKIKNEVLIRAYILCGIVCMIAVAIFGKVVYISLFEGQKWRAESEKKYIEQVEIEADRGNILARDGSLLATSLPFFDIHFDPASDALSDKVFYENIDSLAVCIANFINDPDRTVGGYRDYLIEMRRTRKNRHILIKRNATFEEKQRICEFPIFNRGQFKGGLKLMPKFRRNRPFGILAYRTIGYTRDRDSLKVGLEGRFNDVLAGESGLQLMFNAPGDVLIPVNDLAEIEPKIGDDIQTTIDVDIQDITNKAVYRAMLNSQAKWGVAIVMEVETGAIRAISNLSLTKKGEIWETYNHAVGTGIEPGSVFKIASMMSLLEDGAVKLTDEIDLEQGKTTFYDEEMLDASPHMLDTTTVEHAFEISSNVGIAKLVQEHYGETKRGGKFIQNLKNFHLNYPTGIEIDGEAAPYIKPAYSEEDDWSGTTLPWMSIGYEVSLTPLQQLTFYNAIANDGQLMKPYLVEEIQQYGEKIKRFPPTVIKRKIAKPSTIKTAQYLLKQVVEEGTAKSMKSDLYTFAGKTGTAQFDYKKLKDTRSVGGYQSSFAGYFPAENPKYSIIVVINKPQGQYYGSKVALPVFREIADNIFATKAEVHPSINLNQKPQLAQRNLPDRNVGEKQDLQKVLASLELPYETQTKADFAAIIATKTDSLKIRRRNMSNKTVPNVVGMGLRDALYLLENRGLDVEVKGYGKVVLQSIKPGTRVRGQNIKVTLR